jgi:invasion protein IalB
MRFPLSLFVLTLPFLLAHPAMAVTGDETSVDAPSVTRSTYQDWQSTCVLLEEKPACEITQTMQLEKDGQTSFAMRITLIKQADKTVMEIALPLGLDLPAGIALQVDENNEINIPFVTCVAQGCAAVVVTEDEFLNELRQGTELKVAYRPFGQTQAVVLVSSLRGFTSAIQLLAD